MDLTCVIVLHVNDVMAVQSMRDQMILIELVKDFICVLLVSSCENYNFVKLAHLLQELPSERPSVELDLWEDALKLLECRLAT